MPVTETMRHIRAGLHTSNSNLKRCHKRVKIDSYNLFVKPILNYAATVWLPYIQHHTHKLQDALSVL